MADFQLTVKPDHFCPNSCMDNFGTGASCWAGWDMCRGASVCSTSYLVLLPSSTCSFHHVWPALQSTFCLPTCASSVLCLSQTLLPVNCLHLWLWLGFCSLRHFPVVISLLYSPLVLNSYIYLFIQQIFLENHHPEFPPFTAQCYDCSLFIGPSWIQLFYHSPYPLSPHPWDFMSCGPSIPGLMHSHVLQHHPLFPG